MISKTSRRKNTISTSVRFLGILMASIVLLGLIVWSNQKVAMRNVRNNFPAPGKLIDVNGHKMHLYCLGSKRMPAEPTIIIDAGNASYSLDWSGIQHSLKSMYRVCTYDRSGYGWSESSGDPRDADHVVNELHSLLQAAEENRPFLLVGHSLGGLHMQLFTVRYRSEVAGLVLVESPGTEIQNDPYRQYTIGSQQTMLFLSTSGLLRVLAPFMDSQSLPVGAVNLGKYEQEAYLQLLLDPQHYATALAENKNIYVSAKQVETALAGEHPLGDMPLIVLTSGMIDVPEENNPFRTQRIPAEPRAIAQQATLVHLSTPGKQHVVPNSGHLMQHDAPDAILTAIQEMMMPMVTSDDNVAVP